ncbi:MAG: tetratricopeptide repeat protein [Erythrobacter sp.]|jgi:tetratricopeptide (TPR) repeat protein|nr:tetratricopeptide repeat protein [Erythrobacter sp.]
MDRTVKTAATGRALCPKLALLATAAIAGIALTGCSTSSAPRADVSVNKAQVALEKGEFERAIEMAEAAVRAAPRDPANRALLGAAYLESGRYASAATSFGDAIELGSGDPRTALSYALALTAIGQKKAAIATLIEWEGVLEPVDAGLAMALAGNPERGLFLITNSLRAGNNSAKVRQNLAYAYALAGNWRAARVMAAEDVPADQLDARLSQWASTARPEDHLRRVSDLLGIAATDDPGQPTSLALANFPSQEQMVAEAAAQAPAIAQAAPSQTEALTFARGGDDDLEVTDPTVAKIMTATSASAPAPQPTPKPAPKAAPKPAVVAAAQSGPRFVSNPVVQTVVPSANPASAPATAPARVAQRSPAPVRPAAASAPRAERGADTHLIQLGSYNSRADANAGWEALKRKFPSLSEHDVIITKAEVKGRIFYRVAAAGFGQSSASSMCSTVKSAGRGCFAYAATNPPAGALDEGVRIAAR